MPEMSRHPRKIAWRVALRLGGSAAILALLFRFVPFAQVWQALGNLPAPVWLGVFGAYFCVHLAGVQKYKLMLNGAGAELSFAQAARCYFTGLFGVLLLPSVVGGDVLKAGLALRLGRSKAGVLLGSLLDRLLDLTALVTLAATGALLAPGELHPADRRGFLLVLGVIAAVAVVAALFLALLPARRFPFWIRRWLARLRLAWRSVAKHPLRVLSALGLGFFAQLGFLSLTVLLAAACGLHLPYRVWLFAWPIAKLSAFVPISQAGIGVREAALAGLLVPFGAAAGVVVGAGLAWETVVISAALIGGLISLVLGRCHAGQARDLETPSGEALRVRTP